MKSSQSILLLFILSLMAGCGGGGESTVDEVFPERLVDRNLPNLLAGKNPNFLNMKGYLNADKHKFSKGSHNKDGSGSVELTTHYWKNALTSPQFTVEKGKKYLLSAYVRMVYKAQQAHGQNIVFGVTPKSIAGNNEVTWNVSKSNEWQEILLPFIPVESGLVNWRVFTTGNAFSTDIEKVRTISDVGIYKPKRVNENGSNLNRVARVYFDDFKLIELKNEVTPREKVVDKTAFNSNYIRVDRLGNFSVNKKGQWTPIIPKLISRGSPYPVEVFRSRLKAYKWYGFNGVIGMYDKGQVVEAFGAGLEYLVGMGANSNTQPNGMEAEYSSVIGGEKTRMLEMHRYIKSQGKPYSMLFHYLDNENDKLQEFAFKKTWADYIDANDKDESGSRARPIFYLNGEFGMSRMYGNKLMDITGGYVGLGSTGSPAPGAPKQTIGITAVSHKEQAPANVIQLQTYLGDKFIPSLWFGIIQGGKAISVWRDGTGDGTDIHEPKPFQQYAWAGEIKRVFAELDSIASIIRRPHWTDWKANFKGSEYVNIGTRDYKGDSYLIISNHSDTDETISVQFEGISPKSVKAFLGASFANVVNNGQVNISIGHGNAGYLVLKLEK